MDNLEFPSYENGYTKHSGYFTNSSGTPVNIADSKSGKTIGFEKLSIGQTATVLTASVYLTAVKATITVEDANIRFRTDGTAPTTSTGLAGYSGLTIILESPDEIKNFKAIAVSGTAALNIEYKG